MSSAKEALVRCPLRAVAYSRRLPAQGGYLLKAVTSVTWGLGYPNPVPILVGKRTMGALPPVPQNQCPLRANAST